MESTRIGIIFPDLDRHRHPGPAEKDLYPFQPIWIRIRIRRIHMFLGLPDRGPLVRYTDPDPAPCPSIIKQKQYRSKNIDLTVLTSL